MSYGYIYKTVNTVNGHFYIGQHKGLFHSRYLGSGIVLRKAVRQYTPAVFVVKFIASGETLADLDWMEKHLISEYREAGYRKIMYNVASGGVGKRNDERVVWNKGLRGHFKQTNEARSRISSANKGRVKSERERHALSVALRGKPKSESAKQRMRERHADVRGEKHPQWNPNAKSHKLRRFNCVDCDVLITLGSTRCVPCRNRENGKKRWAK